MSVQRVNLLWQRKLRGLLPVSGCALNDDGGLIAVRPDEIEPRTYQILRIEPNGEPRELAAVSVETVRRFAVTPDASLLIGMTEDDLYLFRQARKARFMPDRRVSYLDVAVAPGGAFAFAFTDMMAAAHTLAYADGSGRLVWTRDLEVPILRVAISGDGERIACGTEHGANLLLTRNRTPVWECVLDEPVTAIALAPREATAVVGTQQGTLFLVPPDGGQRWRSQVTFPAIDLAMDAAAETIALVAGEASGGSVACFDSEGSLLWSYELPARPTGVALSPAGRHLAVSLADGTAMLFAIELRAMEPGGARSLAAAEAALAAGELEAARQHLLAALAADPTALETARRLIDTEAQLLARWQSDLAAARAERRWADALTLADRALALRPTDEALFRLRCELHREAVAAWNEAAEAHLAAGDPEAAAAALTALLAIAPTDLAARTRLTEARRQLAQRLLADGDSRRAAGDLAGAVDVWQRALALSAEPELEARLRDAEIEQCMALGKQLYAAQRFAEAAFQFRRVCALDPSHAEARRYLGYVQSTQHDSVVSNRFARLE